MRSISIFNLVFVVCWITSCASTYQVDRDRGRLVLGQNEPCDDMYRYSCKDAVESRWESAGKLYEKQVTYLLQGDVSSNDRPRLQQLRKLYKSCKNDGRRSSLGDRPLIELIEKLGKFPVWNKMNLEQVTGSDIDLVNTLIRFKLHGVDFNNLFSINVKKHPLNNVAGFELTYPNVRLLRYPIRSLSSHLVSILYQFVTDIDQLDPIRGDLDDVVKFVDGLRQIMLSRNSEIVDNYPLNILSLQELELIVDQVDWSRLLSNLADRSLDISNTKVIIPKTFELNALNELLKSTKLETIVNYLFLEMIEQSATKLNSPLASLVKERPLTCLEFVGQYLGPVLIGELVVDWNSKNKNQLAQLRNSTSLIFDDIKREMINLGEITSSSDDKATKLLRATIKDKANRVKLIAGYEDQHLDETLMDSLYGRLNVDESSFFKNWLKIRRLNVENDFAFRFDKQAADYTFMSFLGHPSFVGAMYQPELNAIHLSLGMLSSKKFTAEDEAANYGLMGSVLGHELSHSLDRNSIMFDENGDYKQPLAIFDQSAQYKSTFECLKSQYDGKLVAGTSVKLNGTRTINENFCDMMGYQLAYRAFASLDNHKSENDEIFWKSAASLWCEDPNLSPWDIAEQSKDDPHSPSEFRVNLAMSSSAQFAKTFECSVSNEKCDMLWKER